MNVRKIALELLLEYENEGKYINLSLSSHKADSLTREERSFLTALLYTTVEKKITYDYYIGSLAERSLDKIDTVTKNVLRLGFSQILDMDFVPDFAAVNETVSLAKNSGSRAFVNGVLRRLIREKGNLPLPKREKNISRYLSVRYSFPLHIVKHFINVLGESGAEEYLDASSKIPPTDLSVNTLKISVDDFIKKLSDSGISATAHEISPITVRIFGSVDPREIRGYNEGEFFVQDAASAIAITALNPRANERIIDVCSAPGGKSMAAAILSENKGEIISYDLHKSKLSLIEDSANRLSLSSVSVSERDATCPDESLYGRADKVICDVPCSGLGVLRKKPDLRYKSKEGIDALPALQYEILKSSVKYLKDGGVILYSTCTVNPEENEGVVERFLRENEGYTPLDFNLSGLHSENGRLTLYTHIHNTDGFFIALIKKGTSNE